MGRGDPRGGSAVSCMHVAERRGQERHARGGAFIYLRLRVVCSISIYTLERERKSLTFVAGQFNSPLAKVYLRFMVRAHKQVRTYLHTYGPQITGERHRKQRKMLNPVFSIKHMKHMTPIFYDVAHSVCSSLPTLDGRLT